MKRSVRFTDDSKQHDGGKDEPKRRRLQEEEGEGEGLRHEPEQVDEDLEEGDGVDRFSRDKKHTLDSDEEYEEENYRKLDMKKVEGQEEATQDYEGAVKIMAFNMKEDMEEGHFDSGGNFIFNKKQEEIKDAWLDNVDWDNVKTRAGERWNKLEDADGAAEPSQTNLEVVYNRLLELLATDKETIAGALKRMNNERGLSAAEERKRRWAAKKAGAAQQEDPSAKTVAELTSLADSLVSLGRMDAYQLNPAKIKALLQEVKSARAGPATSDFDMFGDNTAVPNTKSNDEQQRDEQTAWEYQLKDAEGRVLPQTHGPITTALISELSATSEKFKHGAMVRRVGAGSAFHDIKRIDFELYD